jgi:hypothetical protein
MELGELGQYQDELKKCDVKMPNYHNGLPEDLWSVDYS